MSKHVSFQLVSFQLTSFQLVSFQLESFQLMSMYLAQNACTEGVSALVLELIYSRGILYFLLGLYHLQENEPPSNMFYIQYFRLTQQGEYCGAHFDRCSVASICGPNEETFNNLSYIGPHNPFPATYLNRKLKKYFESVANPSKHTHQRAHEKEPIKIDNIFQYLLVDILLYFSKHNIFILELYV